MAKKTFFCQILLGIIFFCSFGYSITKKKKKFCGNMVGGRALAPKFVIGGQKYWKMAKKWKNETILAWSCYTSFERFFHGEFGNIIEKCRKTIFCPIMAFELMSFLLKKKSKKMFFFHWFRGLSYILFRILNMFVIKIYWKLYIFTV